MCQETVNSFKKIHFFAEKKIEHFFRNLKKREIMKKIFCSTGNEGEERREEKDEFGEKLCHGCFDRIYSAILS
jgi:formylmethanofuran dehydrogenase subunit E